MPSTPVYGGRFHSGGRSPIFCGGKGVPKPIELRVSEQLTLVFDAGADLARVAQLSRHEALRDVGQLVSAAIERTSALDDWCDHCIERGGKRATADADALFVSYFRFCDAVRTPMADRLSYEGFGQALGRMGFGLDNGASRALRVGCRLKRRSFDIMRPDPGPDVDQFLSERCRSGREVTARVRSPLLHQAYCNWAEARGERPLSLKRFGDAMRWRGFERKQSNGIWWLGIDLLPSPRPLHDDVAHSDA